MGTNEEMQTVERSRKCRISCIWFICQFCQNPIYCTFRNAGLILVRNAQARERPTTSSYIWEMKDEYECENSLGIHQHTNNCRYHRWLRVWHSQFSTRFDSKVPIESSMQLPKTLNGQWNAIRWPMPLHSFWLCTVDEASAHCQL